MKQTSMNISLSPELRDFVEQKCARDRYSSASEYVRQLIREDLKREAREKVDQLLLEGLASGPAKPMTKKDWETVRKRAFARAEELRRDARSHRSRRAS
jgi:antitoxin ParD1/3/4